MKLSFAANYIFTDFLIAIFLVGIAFQISYISSGKHWFMSILVSQTRFTKRHYKE